MDLFQIQIHIFGF